MSTDLATTDHGAVAPVETPPTFDLSIGQVIAQFGHLADQIARTEFVPASFRGKPEAVLAAMLYGRELGLGPMQSLNLIQSIQGSVGLKPEGMRALVRTKGHRIWPVETTDERVTLCGWRQGDPPDAVVTVTWTLADADRAGLRKGANWAHYPRAMLTARATSELCRLHFADVIGGLSYTPEEIAEFDTPPPSAQPSPAPTPSAGVAATPASSTPATTRRAAPKRPAPAEVPEGCESAVDGKKRLLAAYEQIMDDPSKASVPAYELWTSHGLGHDPVPTSTVDALVAFVLDPAAAQRSDDQGDD